MNRREFLASSALAAATRAKQVIECDLCIVGATSGGIIAAVQAVQMGGSVIIVEHGEHVGGMSAGGLSWTDFTHRDAIGGLADEFYRKVGARYGSPSQLALEPHVAEEVFLEMEHSPRIEILFSHTLASVKKSGTRIIELRTTNGKRIRAKMFLDATYEGDLMAAAGVTFTVGREANAQYSETLNGTQQGSTNARTGFFTVPVDPYLRKGDPSSGVLPYLLQDGPVGTPGAADKRVQAYCYRLCLTDAENRIPIAPPREYSAAKFELLARWIEARVTKGDRLKLSDFLKYDPLPNRKWDFNNRWAISVDYLGGADRYPEAGWAERRSIERAHEDYLRGFLHFLATDARVPAEVRTEMKRFGLCRDEFTRTGGWPHQIYVREGRRMVSSLVMTEHHVLGETTAAQSIGLASYGIDIHAVRRIVIDGRPVNEGSKGHAVPGPYSVGYGSIVPRREECTNLFVTFCLSASHIGFASIRMEPVFMILSQSAATAAMLAIQTGTAVQDVNFEGLRKQLVAGRQVLTWPLKT